MSKNTQRISLGYGLVFRDTVLDYLVGKVLTIIEAVGMKESQEKSIKDLIKDAIYGEIKSGIGISDSLHNEIARCKDEVQKLYDEHYSKHPTEPWNGLDIEYKLTYIIKGDKK